MIVKSQDGMKRVPYNQSKFVINDRYWSNKSKSFICVIYAYYSNGCAEEMGFYASLEKAKKALDKLDGYYINNKSWCAMPQDSEV